MNCVLRAIGTSGAVLLNRVLTRLAPNEAARRALDLTGRPFRRVPPPPELPGKSFRIDVGPQRLRAWDLGEGPTVLLVHGWKGHAGQMRGFAERLVAQGYSVIAFDLPAHGRSTGERATLVEFTEAVRAVAWRVRPVHAVIAHSVGAAATAVALTRDLEIDRAVLLAPPVEMAYFIRRIAATAGFDSDAALRYLRDEIGIDPDDFDLRRLAPARRTPLLVMHDPADTEVPYEHGHALAQRWPDTRLLTVHGKGHRKILSDPEVIDTAVGFVVEARTATRRTRTV